MKIFNEEFLDYLTMCHQDFHTSERLKLLQCFSNYLLPKIKSKGDYFISRNF